jgi:hypothetical protein
MTLFGTVSKEEQDKDISLLREQHISVKPQDLVNVRDNMEQVARQLAEQPGTSAEQKKALSEYMADLQTPDLTAGDLIIKTNAVLDHFPSKADEPQQNGALALALMRNVVAADSGLDRDTAGSGSLAVQKTEDFLVHGVGSLLGAKFDKPN